ncbi:MAG: hypothetical protein AAF694_04795 [Bacteroidota bacterium]
MKIFHIIFISCILFVCITGCEEDEEQTPAPIVDLLELHVSELENLDLELKVLSEKPLVVGYNRIRFSLRKRSAKRPFTSARLTILPIMEKANSIHSAPSYTPIEILDENRFFQQDIVFIEPSGEVGSWQLNVNVKDLDSGKQQNLKIPIEVEASTKTQLKSFISAFDERSIFVSLVEPQAPDTGLNEFTLGIHYRENTLSYPLMRDLQIEIEPEMPEMGHGSEGNINPVFNPGGLYDGTVFFNMPGLWRINIRIADSTGNELGETYFEVNF